MSEQGIKKRRRLLTLWEEKNHKCPKCGKPMCVIFRDFSMKSLQMRKDEATLEHLESRLTGQRQQVHGGEKMLDILCRRCNNVVRNREDEDAVGIEELHRRANMDGAGGKNVRRHRRNRNCQSPFRDGYHVTKDYWVRRCILRRPIGGGEWIERVSFIPEQYAHKGNVIKFQDDGQWSDGWRVALVGVRS